MLAKVIRFRERLVGVLHILSSRRFDCFISTFTENLWNYRHSSNFDALNDIFDVLWMSDFGTRIKLKWFFMDQQRKGFVLTDKPRRHFLGNHAVTDVTSWQGKPTWRIHCIVFVDKRTIRLNLWYSAIHVKNGFMEG